MIHRLRTLLYGMGYVFDAFLFDHVTYFTKRAPDGGMDLGIRVCKLHPSYACGFIRCVILGDKCGSALYGAGIRNRKWRI